MAVIGPLADNPSDPEGTSSAPKSGVLSLPAELARRLGESNVLRAKGGGILKTSDEEIAAAVATAKRADLGYTDAWRVSRDERGSGVSSVSWLAGTAAGIARSYRQYRQAGRT